MPALNRAERKQRTRRRLLDAARSLFLEHGFNGCSIETICATAGFTTGAAYANFGSKTKLAMQVLDELYLEEAEKVGQKLATSTDHSLEAWAALLDTWTQHTIGEPRWARFERELTGATAADDELIQAAAHRYAALRSQIALLAQTRAGHDDANWDELGVLILGLILGVALQRVADPNLAIASIPHALKILTAQPPPP